MQESGSLRYGRRDEPGVGADLAVCMGGISKLEWVRRADWPKVVSANRRPPFRPHHPFRHKAEPVPTPVVLEVTAVQSNRGESRARPGSALSRRDLNRSPETRSIAQITNARLAGWLVAETGASPACCVPSGLPLPPWMLLFDAPKPSCMKNAASDDADMGAAWPMQQVDEPRAQDAPPALQLAASRHRLAAIMNTEDAAAAAAAAVLVGRAAASKSSLAFILGGSADEDQARATGPSFADLTVGSSVSASENRAANVPAAAAPKAAVKKSRICKFENCTRYVVNRGLCIGHGAARPSAPWPGVKTVPSRAEFVGLTAEAASAAKTTAPRRQSPMVSAGLTEEASGALWKDAVSLLTSVTATCALCIKPPTLVLCRSLRSDDGSPRSYYERAHREP
ncbi:hypothetical protein ON010_g12113 [Phytophthora cinnamomi]|nr:hypothetical protein ON010_g12113 [Phytophthora cinnamomi]